MPIILDIDLHWAVLCVHLKLLKNTGLAYGHGLGLWTVCTNFKNCTGHVTLICSNNKMLQYLRSDAQKLMPSLAPCFEFEDTEPTYIPFEAELVSCYMYNAGSVLPGIVENMSDTLMVNLMLFADYVGNDEFIDSMIYKFVCVSCLFDPGEYFRKMIEKLEEAYEDKSTTYARLPYHLYVRIFEFLCRNYVWLEAKIELKQDQPHSVDWDKGKVYNGLFSIHTSLGQAFEYFREHKFSSTCSFDHLCRCPNIRRMTLKKVEGRTEVEERMYRNLTCKDVLDAPDATVTLCCKQLIIQLRAHQAKDTQDKWRKKPDQLGKD